MGSASGCAGPIVVEPAVKILDHSDNAGVNHEGGPVHTRTRYLTILAAMAVLATACGGGTSADTTTTTTTTTAAPAAESTTTTAPTTTEPTPNETPPPTPGPTVTEAPPPPTTTTTTTIPFGELPSLFDAVDDDGLLSAAGEYRAEKLSHGIRHVITEDVAVRGDGQVFYLIGRPGFDVRTDAAVFFIDVAGLPLPENVGVHCHGDECDPDGYTAIRSVDELDAFFSETPGVVLLDSGTSTDRVTLDHWWEFTTDDTAPQSFDENCNFGEQCLNIVYVGGCCYFLAGEEWTYRLWRLGHGDGAVYAWFQARNEDYADDLPFAEMIVEGATVIAHH